MPSRLEATLVSPTMETLAVTEEQVAIPTDNSLPESVAGVPNEPTATKEPVVDVPDVPTPTEESVVDVQDVPTPTEDLGPPPSFEDITWPEGENSPEERDGKWYLNDQAVALSYHRNADGEKELWLTLEKEIHWPIMIQNSDGDWIAGVEAWKGNLTIINTNESPLTLTIYSMMEGDKLEELNSQEISPYEVFNMASLPPTDYEFRFQFTADEEFDLTCAVILGQDVPLTFVVVPAGVAVSQPDFVPESSRDLDLRFSPLCGG